MDTERAALEGRLAAAQGLLACSSNDVTSPHGGGEIVSRFVEALGGSRVGWFVRGPTGWAGWVSQPGGGCVDGHLDDDVADAICQPTSFQEEGPQGAWRGSLREVGIARGVLIPACFGGRVLGVLVLGGAEATDLLQSSAALLTLIGCGLGMRMALDRSTFNTTGWETSSSAPPPGADRFSSGAPGFISSDEAMRRITSMGQLASLGTLAGGLVHEINNPATFIALAGGQIEKAIARVQATGDHAGIAGALELTAGIEDSTRQIRDMVAAFRLLVGISNQSVVVTVDLERVLAAAVELTRAAHRHDAVFHRDIKRMPPCPGRYLEIGPVVINVLVNAIQSFRDTTTPKRVDVEAEMRDEAVSIRVTDTGRGIPETTLPRVFDPFFTTKDAQRHAGLGLTIARATVERLGGSIGIRSEEGKGTTVEILVPLQDGQDEAEA